MTHKLRALSIHLLTATGAVFALLALLSAINANWSMMVLWLMIAFVVDGIDGPLARKYDVKTFAPQVDGALLDLIIDYLTYVFIPAYALYASGILPGWMGWAGLFVITFASAIYFAYTGMKTQDASFQGFPGCWNMVVLVVFAVEPPGWASLVAILVLAAAMFLPIRFIHPVRTARWRAVSLPIAVLWTMCAIWAAWTGFGLPEWGQVILVATTTYLVFAGLLQQIMPPLSPRRASAR